MIKATNLTKSFGSTKAVNDLSFEINTGEIVGFLGPNGAGKTTTMRLLTGFYSPDVGHIEIDGISLADNPIAVKKLIGYLPENNPLYKEMLVSEFLELSAELHGIAKDKRKEAFDFAVSAVGIEKVFYTPISELSKGFKQRVGIASVLLHKPKIIIMDEPTEGLDPNQRQEIRSLIKKLALDHTIILSTHVMQEASAVCNRMIIINNGALVADGSQDKLTKEAKKEKVILLEVEGFNVDAGLRGLNGLQSYELKSLSGNKFSAKLNVFEDALLQPQISKIACQNNWIIWKLYEEEYKMEDVFHELTMDKGEGKKITN